VQLGKKKEEGENGGRRGAEGEGEYQLILVAMSSSVVVTGKQMQVHDDSWVVSREQTSN
jgi:hypothetical protein